MVTAYILIKANTGDADRLLNDVLGVAGIVDAHIVAGDVDLIAKVAVDSPSAVKDVAAAGIQGIDGVESTETYLTMD